VLLTMLLSFVAAVRQMMNADASVLMVLTPAPATLAPRWCAFGKSARISARQA